MFEIYFEELHYLVMLLLHKINVEFILSDKRNDFPERIFSFSLLHFNLKKKERKKVAHIQEVSLFNSVG